MARVCGNLDFCHGLLDLEWDAAGLLGDHRPMRFTLLGSGSSGNAALFVSRDAKILVDAGLSFRQLMLRAEAAGESLDGLDAVFVTHEHGDHVNGVGVLARRMNVPVHMTARTRDALPDAVGKVPNLRVFEAGENIQVRDIAVTTFSVEHDAADPVSFVLDDGHGRVGMAADLGRASNPVRHCLAGSQALVLESNHCPKLLGKSSYPASVRQRINGEKGHLSNHKMASLLHELLHDGLELVVLVHISQENNTEELARQAAQSVLRDHSARLVVATQDVPTPVFTLGARVPVRAVAATVRP